MFFLVAAIASNAPHPDPFTWMWVELVVGGIFIAGVLGIGRIVALVCHDGE
jgi:hypothetical protein